MYVIARNGSDPGAVGSLSTMRLVSTASSSPSSTSNPNASSSPSNTREPAQGGGGVNTVAIGAGVGAGAGIVLVALLAGFIIIRRRRQKRANALEASDRSRRDVDTPTVPPYDINLLQHGGNAADMKAPRPDPQRVHELPAFGDPTEVDGYTNEYRKGVSDSETGEKGAYTPQSTAQQPNISGVEIREPGTSTRENRN